MLSVHKPSRFFENVGLRRINYHKWIDNYRFKVTCLRCRLNIKGETKTLKSSKYKARRTITCKCED